MFLYLRAPVLMQFLRFMSGQNVCQLFSFNLLTLKHFREFQKVQRPIEIYIYQIPCPQFVLTSSWSIANYVAVFLVEKADDLNSELKRDYSNGQYKLLTPRDTNSFNTTPPSQWGTASSDLSFKAQEIVLS